MVCTVPFTLGLLLITDRYHQERGMNEPAIACLKLAQSNLYSCFNGRDNSSATDDVDRARILLAETHRNMGCNAAEINKGELARHNFQIYNNMMIEASQAPTAEADPRLPISYFELATAHIMLRNWDESMRCNHAALEEAAKIKDVTRLTPIRTLTLTNLACACLLTGRIEEALGHASMALKEREALYGPNDRQSMMYDHPCRPTLLPMLNSASQNRKSAFGAWQHPCRTGRCESELSIPPPFYDPLPRDHRQLPSQNS